MTDEAFQKKCNDERMIDEPKNGNDAHPYYILDILFAKASTC